MKFAPSHVEAFAVRLADARAAKGWTRQQLVDAVDGVSEPQQIYNYERAQRTPERVEIVVGLEVALDLPPGTLCRLLGFDALGAKQGDVGVADAIAADEALSYDAKQQLLSAYRRLRQ